MHVNKGNKMDSVKLLDEIIEHQKKMINHILHRNIG